MATMLERTKMIFKGAFNRDPTTAELARVAEGLFSVSPAAYAALSDADKVKVTPIKCRQWLIRDIGSYERGVAAQSAADAAQASVDSALPDADLA